MTHVEDADLAALAGTGGHTGVPHLRDCQHCRARLTQWQRIAAVTAAADATVVGALTVPSFDALLGPALRGALHPVAATVPDRPRLGLQAPPPVAAAPGAAASWRLVAALVAAQLRLAPKALLPGTALALLGAVGLALAASGSLGLRLFTAAVPLLVVAGALAACRVRDDPRAELLSALPIGPPVVLGLRLGTVLAIDVALAVLASVLLAGLGHTAGIAEVVAGWLGQALLASAVGVVGAIRGSPAMGGAAAVALWGLGAVVGPVAAALPTWLRDGVAQVWSTTPWTIGAALLLYGVAVAGMRFPRTGDALA